MRHKLVREDNGVPTIVQTIWSESEPDDKHTFRCTYFDGLETSISLTQAQFEIIRNHKKLMAVLELEFERKWLKNARRLRKNIIIDIYKMDGCTSIEFLTD